jgi:acyl carrier protein
MQNINVIGLVMESVKEILSEIDEIDINQLPPIDESTRLIGKKAVVNSLGLVSIIVDIEQKLSDNNEIEVTIADDRAMSQEKSPFLTIGTLADYVSILIDEQTQPAASEAAQA